MLIIRSSSKKNESSTFSESFISKNRQESRQGFGTIEATNMLVGGHAFDDDPRVTVPWISQEKIWSLGFKVSISRNNDDNTTASKKLDHRRECCTIKSTFKKLTYLGDR